MFELSSVTKVKLGEPKTEVTTVGGKVELVAPTSDNLPALSAANDATVAQPPSISLVP